MVAAAAVLAGMAHAGGGWRTLYLHDEDQSSMVLTGIGAGGGDCLVAVGGTVTRGRPKAMALVSRDRGKNFTTVTLKDSPRSVFVLDAGHAWMVSESAVWASSDCGVNWTRLHKDDDLFRVYFLDAQRGFAAGLNKKVLATSDGGKSWTKVAAAAEPAAEAERSAYGAISFAGSFGIIAGFHEPRRPDASPLPDWMDPNSARRRRQWPSLTLLLQTLDGGVTWKASSSSILGKMTQVRLDSGGYGLLLIEFDRAFEVPAEVYRLDYRSNKMTRVYRDKDRAITDVLVAPGGRLLLAGYEPAGALPNLPIPGKVKMLEGTEGGTWRELEVDYRAVARRVMLAADTSGAIFAATDTGMLLGLDPSR
jgi:hypothetical protein